MHTVFERRMLGGKDITSGELAVLAELDVGEKRAKQIINDSTKAASSLMRRYGMREFLTETRVNPGERLGRVDFWGTADLIAADLATLTLLVGDLKTGRGRVDVEFNDQLLSYALGALDLVDFVPDRVVLAVFQPPVAGDKALVWETDVGTLDEFAQYARARAALTDDPTNPPTPSREACMWCPARGVCPVPVAA